MKKVKTAYIYPLLLLTAAFCASDAAAQLNESINVEGKYVPEIIHADRINTYPSRLRFNIETSPLNYETAGVPTAFEPDALTLPATGWRASRTPSRYRGYVDLGLGSWLNSTLSAGYSFIDGGKTRFGVRLQHNSISLWKPGLLDPVDKIKQFRYDEAIGLYASHDLGNAGRISGSLDYHAGYFNYYGYNPSYLWATSTGSSTPFTDVKAPTQTLNDIAFRAMWNTKAAIDDISAYAGAGVRYFGYRAFHNPAAYVPDFSKNRYTIRGARETDVNLLGGLLFPTSTTSAVGFDADINVVAYSGGDDAKGFPVPDTYGIFTITPYYSFTRSNLNVRIGADLDFAAKAGIKGDRYNAFHIAPDVKVDFRGKSASLYLHLLGGSRLNTLAANSALDYYQTPYIYNSEPVYTPLDAKLGAGFGPFAGFSANIGIAYRISRGERAGGDYMTVINQSLQSTYMDDTGREHLMAYMPGTRYNLHGFSVNAELVYRLGDILEIDLAGTYQPQKEKEGYFNGYDRPRLTADASLQVNPTDKLKIRLGYQYRGVRNCWYSYYCKAPSGKEISRMEATRLPDITLLNLGASYSFTDRFSLWAQADNLLNRHVDFLPSLPQNGIIITGGFSFLF